VALDDLDSFLAVTPEGKVTVYSGKVGLGTGVRTAMAQIAAEELDIDIARVTVIQGDTLLTPDQGITAGSLSVQVGGMQLRQAAATARQKLLHEAARRSGYPVSSLAVNDGVIRVNGSARSVTYGQLVGGKPFSLKVDQNAPLKKPDSCIRNRL
jgi:CO/xanthine dehydrogenase Mo-binding subunit